MVLIPDYQHNVIRPLTGDEFASQFVGQISWGIIIILLCRSKDNLEVEYALQSIHKPMGVS